LYNNGDFVLYLISVIVGRNLFEHLLPKAETLVILARHEKSMGNDANGKVFPVRSLKANAFEVTILTRSGSNLLLLTFMC
jgi:hypothetical protein